MERKTYIILVPIFLVIIYTVGRIGLSSEVYSLHFQNVTWINLVITAALTFAFHRGFTSRFVLTCISIFAAGFLVEWLGVKTGKIFGEYQYGKTLGIKLDEIPILIGLNWLVLVYAVTNLLLLFRLKKNYKVLLGALLLVLLDWCMEPFAVRYDLWLWKENTIPLQNYIGWFIVSLPMLWLMNLQQEKKPVNRFAGFVYILQLVFFISFLLS